MAMGHEELREALRTSVMSVAALTPAQINDIGGLRLRVATIIPGEALTDWSRRVDSRWAPAFTAAINGVDQDSPSLSCGFIPQEMQYGRRLTNTEKPGDDIGGH